MSNPKYTGAHVICELVADHQALEILELRDRVRDLESANATLRETLHASVALNHTLTEQNSRLRICLRREMWQTYGVIVERKKAA